MIRLLYKLRRVIGLITGRNTNSCITYGRDYQFDYVKFDINPGESVLDLGSGNHPFPLATHLADLHLEDNSDRGGESIVTDARPLSVVNIECLPFNDNEFDFVYCSHVLEHVSNPVAACLEIMRVGKRGYIETPTRASDMLYNFSYLHRWHVNLVDNALIFIEYSDRERIGTGCSHFVEQQRNPYDNPVKQLIFNNRDLFCMMYRWNEPFSVYCFRQDGSYSSYCPTREHNICLGPGDVGDLCKSNSLEAYEKFWSSEELIDAYLEPARLKSYVDIIARINLLGCARGKILDIGFGSGDFLRMYVEKTGSDQQNVYGIDYSQAAVARAIKILPKGRFSTGNVYSLPFENGYFDLVCCIQTLEHLIDPEKVLDEMDRVCSAEGKIVISIPNGDVDNYDGHINFWSAESFHKFLSPRVLTDFQILNDGRSFMAVVEPCK